MQGWRLPMMQCSVHCPERQHEKESGPVREHVSQGQEGWRHMPEFQKLLTVTNFDPQKTSFPEWSNEWMLWIWVTLQKANQSKKSKPPPRASIYLTGLYVSSRQSCWKAQLPHNRSEQTCQDIKEDEVVTSCMNTISAVCIWFVFVYGHKSCEYRAHGHKT